MRRVALVAGLTLALAPLGASLAGEGIDPTELWRASRSFGPEVSGSLLVRRGPAGWIAEIGGFTVRATMANNRLEFALPGGRGHFSGKREGRAIRGFWYQPRGETIGAFATPVSLISTAAGWSGEVVALPDVFTMFLAVGDDGRAYLRNPERHLGRRIPVTRLVVEGASAELRGGQPGASATTLARGSYDREAGALRFPIQGWSYDFVRAELAASTFVPRPREPLPLPLATPAALADGWGVATPEAVGLDRARLVALLDRLAGAAQSDVETPQIHGVLIARHGKLVVEEYFHGHGRDTPHDIRSAGKGMTSILIGAARLHGVAIGAETPVYATLGGSIDDPRKSRMTLGDLMTMRSGLACDDSDDDAPANEDRVAEQTEDPTLYRYILKAPMGAAPGSIPVYCSANALLAGAVLRRGAGEPLVDLFDRWLARPLQMGMYHLGLTPAGELYTAGGARLRPRDMLKFAQLFNTGGTWRGHRIVSADWLRAAGAPRSQLYPKQAYGYFWNVVDYPWNGRTVRAIFAAGNGGQIFMAVPELDLAIGFTGGSYNGPGGLVAQRRLVPEDILPAVL